MLKFTLIVNSEHIFESTIPGHRAFARLIIMNAPKIWRALAKVIPGNEIQRDAEYYSQAQVRFRRID